MLLASMNPCPCGYHGAPSGQGENLRECNCAPQLIQKYRAKISGPLLYRIDMHLTVHAVEYKKNWQKHDRASLPKISGNEWSVSVKFRSSASGILQAEIIPK
jgi:predicted ATPase with chaperone activity